MAENTIEPQDKAPAVETGKVEHITPVPVITSEQKIVVPVGGVANLKEHLAVILPEMDQSVRLERFINRLEDRGELSPLETDPSGTKSPLVSEAAPGVIIKRFDKGTEKLDFETERGDWVVLEQKLGQRFLAETDFVEISDATDPKKRYYVLQNQLEGVQYKPTADIGRERLGNLSEGEIEERYVQVPENWA